MEKLQNYFNINPSFRENYIKNNNLLDIDDNVEKLYDSIYSDADIILSRLCISPSKCGYVYWKDAVFVYILMEKTRISICNDIYPTVAKKHNKTAVSVERAMRICFENALYYTNNNDRNSDFICEYFKNSLKYPRNSDILAKMVELVVSKSFQKNKFKFYSLV